MVGKTTARLGPRAALAIHREILFRLTKRHF